MREIRRRVEHVDTDAAGVMHFTRYTSLLETAALENLERLGFGAVRLGRDGLDLAVAESRMKYSAPARFLDPLGVGVRVDRVGGASFRLSGAVRRVAEPKTVLASGSLVLCLVNRSDGTAVPLPERMRRSLRDCLDGDDRD